MKKIFITTLILLSANSLNADSFYYYMFNEDRKVHEMTKNHKKHINKEHYIDMKGIILEEELEKRQFHSYSKVLRKKLYEVKYHSDEWKAIGKEYIDLLNNHMDYMDYSKKRRENY